MAGWYVCVFLMDGEKSWKVRSMATSKYHSALPVREQANLQFGRATTDDTMLVVKKQHLQFQLTPFNKRPVPFWRILAEVHGWHISTPALLQVTHVALVVEYIVPFLTIKRRYDMDM